MFSRTALRNYRKHENNDRRSIGKGDDVIKR